MLNITVTGESQIKTTTISLHTHWNGETQMLATPGADEAVEPQELSSTWGEYKGSQPLWKAAWHLFYN